MIITAPRAQGLVICATTARDLGDGSDAHEYAQVTDSALEALTSYRPAFASPEAVAVAARAFERLANWTGHEGPRTRVKVGPRMVQILRLDLARRERTLERLAAARVMKADLLASYLLRTGEFPPDPVPIREVTRWSRKSRNNMLRTFAQVDFTEMFSAARPPAMVTLTYPGKDWELVTPTGAAAKVHLRALQLRYRRAWGTNLAALWKLEFQRRGAPHFHLFMVPPSGRAHGGRIGSGLGFREWLSLVWADIVGHPDPYERAKHAAAGTNITLAHGLQAKDPNTIIDYFEKHGGAKGGKEYQHIVPEVWQAPGAGPGRFWGYWSLDLGSRAVEVPDRAAVWAARLARRYSRAQQHTAEKSVPRYAGGRIRPDRRDLVDVGTEVPLLAQDVQGLAGAQLVEAYEPRRRWRRLRRRVERFRSGAGWLHLRDGAGFAQLLARAIQQLTGGTPCLA